MPINPCSKYFSKVWACICCTVCLLFSACGKQKELPDTSSHLLQIGDSILTQDRIVRQIPPGLSRADSLEMFQALVDHWVEEQLLFSLAEENLPHMDQIDRRVEAFRRSLIVNEYRRLAVSSAGGSKADDDTVAKYYRAHISEMILDRPLVKGVYLKIDADADRIDQIRRWVKEASPESADKIEKYGLAQALEYDYFVDKWVDWQKVADQIPYRFDDPDSFLKANSDFETSRNGALYLLKIVKYKPSGDTIPLDFAAPMIREALEIDRQNGIGKKFIKDLYNKNLKEENIRLIHYDPATHQKI